MSSAFAIAAVTAVLKDVLNNGLADHDLSGVGSVQISALPPDRIPIGPAEEKSQLNLFMFQVVPNSGWRNAGQPIRSSTGERVSNPPLALDLRYLITAYGEKEFHAETLLGYALRVLHDHPVLTRAMINATLSPLLPAGVSLPPGLAMLATSDLAEQVEAIKVTPHYLNTEEMSRLWSSMQAKYRPTAVFHVSVVLIDAVKPTRAPLPVLRQGADDRGPVARADTLPPFPALVELLLPKQQTAALAGDRLTLRGHHLALESGDPALVSATVHLQHSRIDTPIDIVIAPVDRGAAEVRLTLPGCPAGLYGLNLSVQPNGKPDEMRATNQLALQLAPKIISDLTVPVARTGVDVSSGLGDATMTLSCSPEVLPAQRVSLVLGAREALAEVHPVKTKTLTFKFTRMPAGVQRVRLRVDGAESLLIDHSNPAEPVFDDSQRLTLT